MKSSIVMGAVALSLLAASGCSTMQKDQKMTARAVDVDDSAYINRVERVDRDRGISVRWVNPPTRHVTGGL